MRGAAVHDKSDGLTGSRPAVSEYPRPTSAGPDPDTNTARAVECALDLYLKQRMSEAEQLDPQFARDVAERVQSLALRGGKRLRAQFAWWGWRAGGGDATGTGVQSTLRLGAALELIQTCALIHDDVMDGSSVRRGAPSLHVDFATDHLRSGLCGDHVAYGQASAILAGDLALAWADDLVAEIEAGAPTRQRILGLWRSMRAEMVAGQYLDMYAQADASSSEERALRIALLKTSLYTVERPLVRSAPRWRARTGGRFRPCGQRVARPVSPFNCATTSWAFSATRRRRKAFRRRYPQRKAHLSDGSGAKPLGALWGHRLPTGVERGHRQSRPVRGRPAQAARHPEANRSTRHDRGRDRQASGTQRGRAGPALSPQPRPQAPLRSDGRVEDNGRKASVKSVPGPTDHVVVVGAGTVRTVCRTSPAGRAATCHRHRT